MDERASKKAVGLSRYARSFLLAVLLCFPAYSEPTRRPPSAWQSWSELQEDSLTWRARPIPIRPGRVITYGGEKEGSSARLTRLLSPPPQQLRRWVEQLSDSEAFSREFLRGWSTGEYRGEVPEDAPPLSNVGLSNVDWERASAAQVKAGMKRWISRAGKTPLLYLPLETREAWFDGDFAGIGEGQGLWAQDALLREWLPYPGEAAKYVESVDENMGLGWEIHFKPQKSYGEFENLIGWYREAMGDEWSLSRGPGHHWIVLPKVKGKDQPKRLHQMGEVMKLAQAYVVLKGLEGQSGIDLALHRWTLSREHFDDWDASKGTFTLLQDWPTKDVVALEMRSGTPSDETRRLVQHAIISRWASGDFSGLSDPHDWDLAPNLEKEKYDPVEIAARFGIRNETAKKALERLKEARAYWSGEEREISDYFWVPLWKWTDAPFLSAGKKASLRELGAAFLETVAKSKSGDGDAIRTAMAQWASVSNLTADIERQLRPQPPGGAKANQIMKLTPTRAGPVDVNAIPLGIEYTARFPLKPSHRTIETESENPLSPPRLWVGNAYELEREERIALLRDLANDLARRLNPAGPVLPAVEKSKGSHGHDLGIVFEIKDGQGRKWKVEWDGVGRSYSPKGELVADSERGGHIEVVTPKFEPTPEEVAHVMSAFHEAGVAPSRRMGGGHLNIDLAELEKNPRAMARFLSVFLENRGVLSLMFQHPDRLRNAEPTSVSPALVKALRDFRGSSEELKKLLYDNRFFNARLGRKTQYSQINLTAYLQDVIPEEFLHEDFDIRNDPWRRNFDVDPKVRKMELRFFDAPRNAHESQMQIRVTRAMLNWAINETKPGSGKVSEIDYEGYLEDPARAARDLKAFADRVGLTEKELAPYLRDGMSQARGAINRTTYLPIDEKMAEFPIQEGWGKAVKARPLAQAVASEGRPWSGKPDREARALLEYRRALSREEAHARKTHGDSIEPGELQRLASQLSLAEQLESAQSLTARNALRYLYLMRQENGATAEAEIKKAFEVLSKRTSFRKMLNDELTRSKTSEESTPQQAKYFEWLADRAMEGNHLSPVGSRAVLESTDAGTSLRFFEKFLKEKSDKEVFALLAEANVLDENAGEKWKLIRARDWSKPLPEAGRFLPLSSYTPDLGEEKPHLAFLKRILETHPSPEARAAALSALNDWTPTNPKLAKQHRELLKAEVERALAEKPSARSFLAVTAMERIGSAEGATALAAVLKDPNWKNFHGVALSSLARLTRSPEATALLLEITRTHPEQSIRETAALTFATERALTPETALSLLALPPSARVNSAQIVLPGMQMHSLALEQQLPVLEKLAESSDTLARTRLAKYLTSQEGALVDKILVKLIQDADAIVSEAALSSLITKARTTADFAILAKYANHSSPAVRLAFAKGLSQLAPGPHAKALIDRATTDSSAEVRKAAFDAISDFSANQKLVSEPRLLAMLRSPDIEVRRRGVAIAERLPTLSPAVSRALFKHAETAAEADLKHMKDAFNEVPTDLLVKLAAPLLDPKRDPRFHRFVASIAANRAGAESLIDKAVQVGEPQLVISILDKLNGNHPKIPLEKKIPIYLKALARQSWPVTNRILPFLNQDTKQLQAMDMTPLATAIAHSLAEPRAADLTSFFHLPPEMRLLIAQKLLERGTAWYADVVDALGMRSVTPENFTIYERVLQADSLSGQLRVGDFLRSAIHDKHWLNLVKKALAPTVAIQIRRDAAAAIAADRTDSPELFAVVRKMLSDPDESIRISAHQRLWFELSGKATETMFLSAMKAGNEVEVKELTKVIENHVRRDELRPLLAKIPPVDPESAECRYGKLK